MEREEDEVNDFSDVVDNLINMFGNVICSEVIFTVVESCGGDLNLSIDAIMNITADNASQNPVPSSNNQPSVASSLSTQPITNNQPSVASSLPTQPMTNNQPSVASSLPTQPMSLYASAAHTSGTGAIPKQMQRPTKQVLHFWTDQVREIIANHNQGHRLLILMRGVPGSGKSHLAKQLVEMMIGATFLNYRTHIFSTDDYFMVRGQYQFEKFKLQEAHMWNQNRVKLALFQGLSPVIVDNTNIEPWEMEPYVKIGVANGYIIEVLEPNTPWAKKPGQLVRKNSHNVPIVTIKRMLENYREGITGDFMRRSLGLCYPGNMVPPVRRLIPAIQEREVVESPNEKNTKGAATMSLSIREENHLASANISITHSQVHVREQAKEHTEHKSHVTLMITPNVDQQSQPAGSQPAEPDKRDDATNYDSSDERTLEDEMKQKLLMEAHKRLEEMEKVEKEWENGDNWDEDKQDQAGAICSAANNSGEQNKRLVEPKPQRNFIAELEQQCAKSLMHTVNNCQDWSDIRMFMPKWNDNEASAVTVEQVPIQKISSSTCMEIGDVDVNGKNRMITATARNINEFYISTDKEKIPQKRMLDKSSMTNEQDMLTETVRCKNEEKHFIALRKLFKNIARSDLRDIFDNCQGDVNWAVDIVLDGMANRQFKTVDTEELSDSEDQNIEQCECLSAYNIIPDLGAARAAVTIPAAATIPEAVTESPTQQKKSKKDVPLTVESILIKRQIEKNVVIPDNHYSNHCLKIRNLKRGIYDKPSTSATPDAAPETPDAVPTTSDVATALETNNETTADTYNSDDEESNASVFEEKIVTVMLGREMVAEIDRQFGRDNMEYPDYIVPRISLPLSALNLINAFWMESVMHQIEKHTEQSALMVQQDEEFARQLAIKEAELVLEGKEPAVPDFKEIMDLDVAVALYQKDVAEWRNNIPNDLAGKMSREKLYNLFPDIEQDTLSELLMAHDNNFQSTVEVLLISVGRGDVLETENGVNKFVMEKELKRQEKILEKELKALNEEEWPLLPKGEVVEMATVQSYRDEAEQHLQRRTINYNKAQDYIRRGMPQVASYYSDIAAYHKQKFEQANSMAAASLIHVHALKSPDSATIDLHYLHVNEAKEALDMFIDTHIQKLKESHSRGGVRVNTLFFITGRGLHSPGRPRVKPAVKKRLRERGLGCRERNPGLLTSKVSADDKLAYQIQVP